MAAMRRLQCFPERWLALLAIIVASLMGSALSIGQSGSPSAQQIPFQLSSGSAVNRFEASNSSQYRNVIDELNASKEHLIFTRLLQRSRLVPIINRIQEFDDDGVGLTVLAPRDSAWPAEVRAAFDHLQAQQTPIGSDDGNRLERELAKWLGIDLVDNVNEALQDLMLYHFVDRSIASELDGLAGANNTTTKLLSTLQKSHAHMGRDRPRPLLDEGQKIRMWYNGSATSFGWSYAGGAVSQIASLVTVHNCTRGLVVSLDQVLRAPPTFGKSAKMRSNVARHGT
jgi:Fasciclin domain